MMKGIHVHCPTPGCRNKRLFDDVSATQGIIMIKCSQCHKVVEIDLNQVARGKRYLGVTDNGI
nr:hypothetical protein [uncultured Sellimonas sp.]